VQRGLALEPLQNADIVHEHTLLIAAAAPSTNPSWHCIVLARVAGSYMSVLPVLDFDNILVLEAKYLAVLIEKHMQSSHPTSHCIVPILPWPNLRLVQPLYANAHYAFQLGLAVDCHVPGAYPESVLASVSGIAATSFLSVAQRGRCVVGAHAG